MDNPWIKERILVMEITADASEYTTVFGIVAAVSNLAIFVKKDDDVLTSI